MQVVAFDAYLKDQPPEQLAALQALRERVGFVRGPASALPEHAQLEYEAGLREIQAR